MKVFKFRGKKYVLNVDRLLFNLVMFILITITVVGSMYISTQEYNMLIGG